MYRRPIQSSGRNHRNQTIAKYELGGLVLTVMVAGGIVGCGSLSLLPFIFQEEETLSAQVWVSQGETYTFPEREYGVRPKTGICLSGGGTRALTAAMGQMRALRKMDLFRHVDYLSSVSGGTWAATAFTYYNSGADDDDEFLGPITDPGQINETTLANLPSSVLGHTATIDFEATLLGLLLDPFVPTDQVWIRAVGKTFLEPFGLFDSRNPNSHYFSSDLARVTGIQERNQSLRDAGFHTVRANDFDAPRPYLVANSCLVWPVGGLRTSNLVPFEYTPLYVGSPHPLTICYKPFLRAQECRTVGGGYLEPFAYGSQAPTGPPNDEGLVKVVKRRAPYSLAEAAGTSSSAFAVTLDPVVDFLSPQINYWPVTGAGGEPTFKYSFGDGGSLENFGLIALLRRKVENIVVFINTGVKLNLEYSPANENPPTECDMTDRLPQLFGVAIGAASNPHPYPNNQVFSSNDFAGVVLALQDAKAKHDGVVAQTQHVVQTNDWWGVPGDWTVNILWVYLDRAPNWEDQLLEPIKQEIIDGNQFTFGTQLCCPSATPSCAARASPSGRYIDFPNYKTEFENFPYLVMLTPRQVNLMADLTYWIVMQYQEVFEQFLFCCDPGLEPGVGGNPLCSEGHTCCSSGNWQCNNPDGSPSCAPGEVCVGENR